LSTVGSFQDLIVNKEGKIGEEDPEIKVLLLREGESGLVKMLFSSLYTTPRKKH